MPTPQFPTPPKAAFPAEPAGPPYLYLVDVPQEFFGTTKEFKDGGANYALPNSSGVIRFDFTYNGLTQAMVAPLDTHYNAVHGIAEGFQFRHPRTGVLYNDVHYEVYEYPGHEWLHVQSRHIILIKRPTG